MHISKYLKFIVPTILFFIVLDLFFRSFGLSFNSLFVLFIISTFSAFWITRYKFLPVLLSLISSSSIVLFFITLGEKNLQYIYMAFSSFLFMLSLVGMDRFFAQENNPSEPLERKIKILDSGFNLNQSIIMISIFLFSSGTYGIYTDLDLPTWIVMMVIFFGTLASTFYLTKINFIKSQALELHLDSAKNKTFSFYSFLFALLMAQLVWALSFWPSNQLTIGSLILISYYTAWNVLKSYLRNELTKNVIIYNLSFFMIFGSIMILTSKWDIISTF